MKRTALKRKHAKHVPRRGMPKPKTLTEVCDALQRTIVLYRDHFCCQWCGINARPGRGGGLEVAHLLPKGAYPALRHELLNVLLMCYRCHHHRWHKNPIEAWAWLTEFKGQAFVDHLRLLAQTRTKVDKAAVRVYLETKLKIIETGILNGPAA